ncbi:MAG: S8 family serine peptidase [Peptococcaceae bacterium]|jgi:hypothetical protein|nr:S8 family serine peptidase [Peptococcaceae bacterium]MDH7524223.1 S8 family serine peptidase [Peptococcaceae bacterium]
METVVFTVTFFSKGGLSVYRDLAQLNRGTLALFVPPPEAVEETKSEFAVRGFAVEADSEVGISVSGPRELFEETFGVAVRKERIKYIRDFEKYVFIADEEPRAPFCQRHIEKISFPRQSFELNGLLEDAMPELDYYHLRVPGDIRRIAGVEELHRRGIDGRGINVVMVDTGLYNHRHFRENGYSFNVVPAVRGFDISRDERGHGTAMSSVLLAVAPGINYTVVKLADECFSYPVAAFQKASRLEPDIINCSWGTIGFEPQIYLEIANAVSKGATVVFSSGNGSSDRRASFFQTVCHPDVLSVGGCFPREDGLLEVSDISSSYYSDLFAGRFAPDICGPCGRMPKAQLILFPTQPGSVFDRNNGTRDGTRTDDGWLVSSGTSAAAAYVSGLTALLLQMRPELRKKDLKHVLQSSALDVTAGASFMGHRAGSPGWNKAAGFGFLNAGSMSNYLERESGLIMRNSLAEKRFNRGSLEKDCCTPDIILKNEKCADAQESMGVNFKHRDDLADPWGPENRHLYLRVQNNTAKNKRHVFQVYSAPLAPLVLPAFWNWIARMTTPELAPFSFNVCGPVALGNRCPGQAVCLVEGEKAGLPSRFVSLSDLYGRLVYNPAVHRLNSCRINVYAQNECLFFVNNPLDGGYYSGISIELDGIQAGDIRLEIMGGRTAVRTGIKDKTIDVSPIKASPRELIPAKIIIKHPEHLQAGRAALHIYQKIGDVKIGYLRFVLINEREVKGKP